MDFEKPVKEFLNRHLSKKNIDNDENFFETGLVNSLFAMQLVLFLENEFEVTIENDDLDIENFKNINAIVSFVRLKSA